MYKIFIVSTLTLMFSFLASLAVVGQSDTIYSNRDKIACSIKEITPDAVQFTYPNETLVNTVYKNSVQKIVFKSGRVQVFSESMSLPVISSVDDYAKVVITQVEGETRGLYKVGEVSSSARGGSVYSNVDRVKERAMNKLKMEAAMRGANLVYMAYQKTDGNSYGGYFQASKAAETIYTGVAYSNSTLYKDDFMSRLAGADILTSNKQIVLLKGMAITKSEYSIETSPTEVRITRAYELGGQVFVEGKIRNFDATVFRVIRYDTNTFTLLAENKSRIVNFILPFKS